MRRGFSLIIALLMLVAYTAKAQDWEIGAMAGAAGYVGDLNPDNPFAYNDLAVGLSAKYNFDSTWGLRANFSFSRIHADDLNSSVKQRQDRNLNFSSPVLEASLLADFHFFRFLPQRGRNSYTPYLFAGVGFIDYRPEWTKPVEGKWSDDDNATLDGAKFPLSIPFGAGFKYNLRGPWTIGVEMGYRLTFTDYLDAVSGSQPQGTDRLLQGDGRPSDAFMTAGFTISYTIFKGGCPEWRN